MKKRRFVFLAEVVLYPKLDKMEPIGIFMSYRKALKEIAGRPGIIYQLPIGKTFPDGIGVAHHFHVNDEPALSHTIIFDKNDNIVKVIDDKTGKIVPHRVARSVQD